MEKEYKGPRPMNEGSLAGRLGEPMSSNPYVKGFREHDRWLKGYNRGIAIFRDEQQYRDERQREKDISDEKRKPWNEIKTKLCHTSEFTPGQVSIICDIINDIADIMVGDF